MQPELEKALLNLGRALVSAYSTVAEPTAEEPDELDLAEREVCSCEEAEGLKARVAELEHDLGVAKSRVALLTMKIDNAQGALR